MGSPILGNLHGKKATHSQLILREEALNQIDFKGSLINISFEAGRVWGGVFHHGFSETEIEVFHHVSPTKNLRKQRTSLI